MTRGRKRLGFRALALAALLLPVSCARQPNTDASTFAQASLPRCTGSKLIVDRTFLVFFPPHSGAPNARGPVILHELADHALRNRVYRLDLYGHTDASETERRDRGLGARRAAWVKRYLTQAGIPADMMTTHDLGTSRSLVPNEAGRPEPQNRNVGFYLAEQGTLQEAADREDCVKWLRATFCKPLANAQDAAACDNAISSL